MVVNDWQAHCWRWLRARFAPAASQGRKLRRQRANPVSVVAAQVEVLESRQLLTVTFHGGALLTSVSAQAVYLGSDWQNTSTLQTQKGQLDQFVSTIVQSSYMDMLTNAGYNVGRGTSTSGAIDNLALNKTSGVTDSQIRADLQAMITAGQVQAPGANNLYVIYVEPGVVINTSFGASNTAFLGYHGAFAGHAASGAAADIHYAIIAYPGAPNFSASSQGFASNLDDLTAVSSHEIAESITDPNVNYKALGWYDDQLNGEIGDLAVGHYATLSGFLVQDMVNQQDQIITPGSTQPPPPPPSGLTAPVVTAHAVNSTTANLSWGAVTGSQGYKVFQGQRRQARPHRVPRGHRHQRERLAPGVQPQQVQVIAAGGRRRSRVAVDDEHTARAGPVDRVEQEAGRGAHRRRDGTGDGPAHQEAAGMRAVQGDIVARHGRRDQPTGFGRAGSAHSAGA